MADHDSRSGLQVIDPDECYELLASRAVGRLAVINGGHPLVLPVNYVVSGRDVVFRTDAGTKLLAAERSPVAFQLDDVDEATHRGWSVLVQGHAEEITDYSAGEVRALRDIPLHPWAGGDKAHWVRIRPTSVTGRRI